MVAIPSIIRYDVALIAALSSQSTGWGISPKLNSMPLATSQALNCPFCVVDPSCVFLDTEIVLGLWDGFPISPGLTHSWFPEGTWRTGSRPPRMSKRR